MKKNYIRLFLNVCLFSTTFFAFSQTKNEANQITKNYNLKKLKGLSKKYQETFFREKQKALEMARLKGWRIKYTDGKGSNYELMKIDDRGEPIYYQTHNSDAALSTRTNWLHNGGGLGVDIEGQGMIAYVWDEGLARSTHQEYDGIGGDNRFSIGDGTTTLNFHGAHVTGTIIASGVDPEAKGMAPQASAVGHDWNNDDSEIADAAANGMLLSNHSYGVPPQNTSDARIGAYVGSSRVIDEIMYNAPFYLHVTSAGNSGNDETSNGNPLEGNASFDKLTGSTVSKNNLVVANAQDADIDPANGNLISVVINSGSSEGPTDDLRIKPDITGNGTSLLSTYENADDAYNRISGTSMSSPNVMGSLLLLQQYYNSLNGSFMRSSTLKGLALHTADDNGIIGPDAVWGWGLLNTKKSAETIKDVSLKSEILELELSEGETYIITVKSDEVSPLLASISWTDLPGDVFSGTANDGTPVLVNDLDIRVTQNTNTFEPWKLTSVNSNIKGDNTVDPYERVDLDGASGEYTITVTHKGTLSGGPQAFSLIVTGIQSDFALVSSELEQVLCSDQDTVVNFDFRQGASATTNFTLQNVPSGITANLSTLSLDVDGSLTLTLDDLDNLIAGTYNIEVVANNGNETKTKIVALKIFKSTFSNNPMSVAFPSNGERGVPSTQLILNWNVNENAENYLVEVATSPSFTTLLTSTQTSSNEFLISGLQENAIYYWRIKPDNRCGTGNYSEIFSFQTGSTEDCSNTYSATDFSNTTIISLSNTDVAYVPIDIPDDLLINRLIVNLQMTHESVNDLIMYVQEPEALDSNNIILAENLCDTTDDVNVIFDDKGSALNCSTTAPGMSGTVIPQESLGFSGGKSSQGVWFVAALDNDFFDAGQIDAASITICTSEANTALPSFLNNGINVVANGSYTFQTSDIEASSTSETASQQTYTLVILPTKGTITKNGVNLVLGDTFTQEDINLGNIAFINTQTSLFTDTFKVDITNAVNGWLPNQTINLEATTLSSNNFELTNLSIYPNPSNGVINIRFATSSNDKVALELFDLQGRRVYNASFNSSQSLFDESVSVGNIANGIYLLKTSQGNKSTTKRIIISK